MSLQFRKLEESLKLGNLQGVHVYLQTFWIEEKVLATRIERTQSVHTKSVPMVFRQKKDDVGFVQYPCSCYNELCCVRLDLLALA